MGKVVIDSVVVVDSDVASVDGIDGDGVSVGGEIVTSLVRPAH